MVFSFVLVSVSRENPGVLRVVAGKAVASGKQAAVGWKTEPPLLSAGARYSKCWFDHLTSILMEPRQKREVRNT